MIHFIMKFVRGAMVSSKKSCISLKTVYVKLVNTKSIQIMNGIMILENARSVKRFVLIQSGTQTREYVKFVEKDVSTAMETGRS